MHILFAPDSFKGSLSAGRVIDILAQKAQEVFPGCETVGLPMADGGEGTMEVLSGIKHGRPVPATVRGPLGETRETRYVLLEDGTALVEMAAASGLPLVPPERRDPEKTSTYGTGELIGAALDAGCRHLVVGVGGSATNDGGIGAMAALGVRFLDERGREVAPVGGSLGSIATIDDARLHPAVRDARFTIMCDITNPLLGERGATFVFGPQKGATPAQLGRLENGMARYAALLKEKYGIDPQEVPGSGAAGGLATALLVFLGAKLQSGIQAVLELSGFREWLTGVDLVVTGEGRVDGQSAGGKVLSGVGRACREAGVPAVAVVGSMGEGAEAVYACGIECLVPLVNAPMPLEYAMANAEALCADAGERLFRALRVGWRLG